MSQPAKNHRAQRERNGGDHGEKRERDPRSRRDNPPDRRSAGDRTSSRSSNYPRGSQRQARGVPREENEESKCSNVCSRRGIVMICAVMTNALVLICIVAAHVSQLGMSAMGMGGGSFVDAMIPFEGTELQQVRDLDMQYGQLRAPGVYGGVAFSLTLGLISLMFVVSSTKPDHRIPRKLMIGQFAFQIIGAVGYVVAIGLYLHFVISVNSTEVCTRRERLYARNGYTWMNCNVNGGDAAVALFGIITAILYTAGAVLTAQAIRDVGRYCKERDRYEADQRDQPKHSQSSRLHPDTYV
ncbi:MARVEL domain-containing protein 3 [Paramisgurnus dabryanus]|uniref:MARVEL domain-containing protein 3 n=1 Tax=Paramisgurnus dabryanus TaxID=90735 RepID=UPI0031F39B21